MEEPFQHVFLLFKQILTSYKKLCSMKLLGQDNVIASSKQCGTDLR